MSMGALNFLKQFLYNLFDLRGERRLTALENMLNLRYPFGEIEEQKEWRTIIATEYK
jgi:hypothetical protein